MNRRTALEWNATNPQYVSPDRFFWLVEQTLGRRLPKSDRRRFEGCRCAQDFVSVIAESPIDEFLEISLWKLAQIYVCLLGEFKLARINQKGYDAIDAFVMYDDQIEAGTVEVKQGGIGSFHSWLVKIKDASYSVLIFVGMAKTRNPAKGDILVIPGDVLRPIVARRPKISINKIKYNQQKKGHTLNKWWEYHLLDHSQLRETVTRYVHGIPKVKPLDGTPMGQLIIEN